MGNGQRTASKNETQLLERLLCPCRSIKAHSAFQTVLRWKMLEAMATSCNVLLLGLLLVLFSFQRQDPCLPGCAAYELGKHPYLYTIYIHL